MDPLIFGCLRGFSWGAERPQWPGLDLTGCTQIGSVMFSRWGPRLGSHPHATCPSCSVGTRIAILGNWVIRLGVELVDHLLLGFYDCLCGLGMFLHGFAQKMTSSWAYPMAISTRKSSICSWAILTECCDASPMAHSDLILKRSSRNHWASHLSNCLAQEMDRGNGSSGQPWGTGPKGGRGPTPSWGSARSIGLRVSGLDLFSPGQMRQKKLCSG